MSLVRAAIRAEAIATITAALGLPAGRVTGVRSYPYNTDNLPAVMISTPAHVRESADKDLDFVGSIDLAVMVLGAGTDGIEDDLDAIAHTIETVVVQSAALQALHSGVVEIRTTFQAGDGGEKRPARMEIIFTLLVIEDAS